MGRRGGEVRDEDVLDLGVVREVDLVDGVTEGSG